MAKIKMRGFFIKRRVKKIVEDKNGNPKEVIVVEELPCHVNAAIPEDHKMLK